MVIIDLGHRETTIWVNNHVKGFKMPIHELIPRLILYLEKENILDTLSEPIEKISFGRKVIFKKYFRCAVYVDDKYFDNIVLKMFSDFGILGAEQCDNNLKI